MAGASTVARRRAKPFDERSLPTVAAIETARSKAGEPSWPSALLRLSRNRVAVERRVDSSCRIMSCPVRATLGQWMRRRSSPVTYSRMVKNSAAECWRCRIADSPDPAPCIARFRAWMSSTSG